MAAPVTVPRLGWSMEEGTFVEWLKGDGDEVRVGDPLFVLESDKATETVEAIDAGTLRISAEGPRQGDKVTVGQVIAYLAAGDEAIDQRPDREGGRTEHVRSEPPQPVSASVTSAPSTPSLTVGPLNREMTASPRARRVARELGMDWRTLTGTGRNGRIRERDVRAASSTGRIIPHTPIRRAIAARMVAGVTQAAPVTLHTKADAANLVNLREQFRTAGGVIPSYTDFLLALTARTLKRHPLLQAQWRDEGLFLPPGTHLAIGVDTDAGLFAPVIRDADQRTLRQISEESSRLIDLARRGMLSRQDLDGATFTLTNLGMFGIDAFTPIITLPQCAVLGVGRITRDGVTLSLTFDHRVIDGAPAARFLDELRRCIEAPAPWLLEVAP